jgi:hypothetical protein
MAIASARLPYPCPRALRRIGFMLALLAFAPAGCSKPPAAPAAWPEPAGPVSAVRKDFVQALRLHGTGAQAVGGVVVPGSPRDPGERERHRGVNRAHAGDAHQDAAEAAGRHADDFTVVVPAELLAQQRRTQRVFDMVMVALASISLLVGGIAEGRPARPGGSAALRVTHSSLDMAAADGHHSASWQASPSPPGTGRCWT